MCSILGVLGYKVRTLLGSLLACVLVVLTPRRCRELKPFCYLTTCILVSFLMGYTRYLFCYSTQTGGSLVIMII